MQELHNKITAIKQSFDDALRTIASLDDLEKIRVEFLGKKGHISLLMTELGQLSVDDKKTFGQSINQLKQQSLEQLEAKKQSLVSQQANAALLKEQYFDVTARSTQQIEGHLHPYTQCIEQIEDIFLSMGYEVLDGPELETDYYNFTALNIPGDHPARDMYDTLWTTEKNMLLRTHTSPVQIRAMQTKKPPIAAIVPGRTYRHEAVDASHDFMFMQCEGILVDRNITLSNLFATAQTFLSRLFDKKDLDIRIRPGFFPFVEPGIEIDMRCVFCTKGCSVCKKTTWIEVFPAGLIHPNVLRGCGINPNEYSGFAFGFGLSRLVMLKHGINDIRLLLGGKMKFLEQF